MHPRTLNNVREILLPFTGELPLEPSVHLNDQITAAIEIMVKHNLQHIPVIWNMRPVGQVRLKDAFASVGIRIS
jgi:CBS domain-containing protein